MSLIIFMIRRLAVAAFVLITLAGCKKTIEKIQEDLIIKAMTEGQWKITRFTDNGTDITSSFSTYKFQYYKDKTVDAINGSTVEKRGNWDGDAATMTTWANFDGVTTPLSLINGSWHIDNNSWTFVEATQTTSGGNKKMRLDKL